MAEEASDDVRVVRAAQGSSLGGDNDANAVGLLFADAVVDSEGGSSVWINIGSLPEPPQADVSSCVAGAPVLPHPPTVYPALQECQPSPLEGPTSPVRDAADALLKLKESRVVRKPRSQRGKTEQKPRHEELRPGVTRVDKGHSKPSRAGSAPTIVPVLEFGISKPRRSKCQPDALQADLNSCLAGAPVLPFPPTEYPALQEWRLSPLEGTTSPVRDAVDALLKLREPRIVRKPRSQRGKTEQKSRH